MRNKFIKRAKEEAPALAHQYTKKEAIEEYNRLCTIFNITNSRDNDYSPYRVYLIKEIRDLKLKGVR